MNPACGALLTTVERKAPAPAGQTRREGDAPTADTARQPAAEPVPAAVTVPPVGQRSGRRQFVLAAALVTVAALTVSVVALLQDDDGVTEVPRATSASMNPELVAQVLEQTRPTGLEVRDERTAAVLHWANSDKGDEQRLVQVLATGGGMRSRVEPVTVQRGEVRVDGLDPDTGYCFRAGLVIFWDDPAVVTWSDYRCIRGATVRGPLG
ncbi:fibronectin type III domain-containing protein [Micromonospora sp. NPDC049048]|uniref:fibronectin type III domain-containing protein n=1 Tax=Micromonospora sp. NPDC049048 TaxID=3364263 RepID=UPI0037160E5B